MKTQRTNAKTSGYLLLLMAIVAGLAVGYAMPQIFESNLQDTAQASFDGKSQLYFYMLTGIFFVILLDLIVSWTLFQFFKKDHPSFALYSLILRVLYSIIFFVAALKLTNNISETNFELALANYDSFHFIWSVGLVFFGLHLLFIGILMKIHRKIPTILWILAIIAGLSYVGVHLLKTVTPESNEIATTLNNVLAIPMALGEFCLAIWLIVKGGKEDKS